MKTHEKILLNGTEYGFDDRGSLISIKHLKAGSLLMSGNGGMIDLAYPVGDVEIQRLSNRRSENESVEFNKSRDGMEMEITYARLAESYPQFKREGAVGAKVVIKALPDGKSISMQCFVKNNSDTEIKQVIFPDFDGFTAFGGDDGTYVTHCSGRKLPFTELRTPKTGQLPMTPSSPTAAGEIMTMGSCFSKSFGRWLDFGTYEKGLSIFNSRWGERRATQCYLKLNNKMNTLRIAFPEEVTVSAGGEWESDVFVVTPHDYGWANGIDEYRNWVNKNINRVVPVPKRIKEGLGFRTIWPVTQYPQVKESVIWPYEMLPELAKENKEHGIDELVMWDPAFFTLPFSEACFNPLAGGKEEFMKALEKCKEIGIRLTPFVSYLSVWRDQARKYGWEPCAAGNGWTYHPDMIPQMRPAYGTVMTCAGADIDNKMWQEDVETAFKNFRDLGLYSVSWDQFVMKSGNADDGLLSNVRKHRLEAYKSDPEASFSGEDVASLEISADYMDYTWEWFGWSLKFDIRPFNSVFPSPRVNVNIAGDPLGAKCMFLDNTYINVMLANPDGYDGDAWIAEYPEFSAALKKCHKFKAQFMEYFTSGINIGDCAATRHIPQLRITAYSKKDSLLIGILCTDENGFGNTAVNFDVTPWISDCKNKEIKIYDDDGALSGTMQFGPKFSKEISLSYADMMFFEII